VIRGKAFYHANENVTAKSELFAYEMIFEAKKVCISNIDFNLKMKGNVYAFGF
jgi:hypothetical protein